MKSNLSAATSLLKWARDEGNPAIRSMVEKLYSITLMSATVQRQYAEQVCFQLSCLVLLESDPVSVFQTLFAKESKVFSTPILFVFLHFRVFTSQY